MCRLQTNDIADMKSDMTVSKVFLSIMILLLAVALTPARANAASISGEVTSPVGEGIANVAVWVFSSYGNYVSSAITDQNGSFVTNDLQPGFYNIYLDPPSSDYLSQWYNDKIDQGNADSVVVGNSGPTLVWAILFFSGSITGQVTNELGQGIGGTGINIYASNGSFIDSSSTGQDGNYKVDNLPVGLYKIRFAPPWGAGYVGQWYDNKSDQSIATEIPVTGLAATNANAVLTHGGSISGRVINEVGQGVAPVDIAVYDEFGNLVTSTSSYSDGSYDVVGLLGGNYTVYFTPIYKQYAGQWYNGKPLQNAANIVKVNADSVTAAINAVLTTTGGVIAGKVTSSDGIGIADAEVVAYDSKGNYVSYTYTDQDGYYSLDSLSTGSYSLNIIPTGQRSVYLSQWYNNKNDQSSADVILVTSPGITSGINVVLATGGSISGTVTNSDGIGIANVNVGLYDANHYGGSSITDQNGNYLINALQTGNYKLYFGIYSYYLPKWYNNKNDEGSADIVSVIAPSSQIINTELATGASITGKVTNVDGTGIANVPINVLVGYTSVGGTTSDQNGNYAIYGLQTGNYTVTFMPFSGSGYLAPAAVNIAASAPDMTTLNMTLQAGGIIAGRVTDATGSGIAGVYVDVHNQTSTSEYNGVVATVPTGLDGSYTVNTLPTGNYRIYFDTHSITGYASQWHNNKSIIDNADLVPVVAANTISGINAVLATLGFISGKVTNSDGQGIYNVYVGACNSNSSSCSASVTAPDGSYTIKGLPTDSYSVYFNPDGSAYFGQWYNNKSSQSSADKVSVIVPNTTAGINAVLASPGVISGKVVNAAGTGIANVNIALYGSTDNYIASAVTDQDGNYKASYLNGNYKIQVIPPTNSGYLSQWYNNKNDQSSADLVSVSTSNTTIVNPVLTTGGIISGKISNAGGNGLPNVAVIVFAANGAITFSVSTAQDGTYLITGLPSGNYKIKFVPLGNSGYSVQWYNNKSSQSVSDGLSVTAPNVTTINAVLGSAGIISGKVTDSGGIGIKNVLVQAYDSAGNAIGNCFTALNGSYALLGLQTGNYMIEFVPPSNSIYLLQWYHNKNSLGGADLVLVTAPDTIPGIDAMLIVVQNSLMIKKAGTGDGLVTPNTGTINWNGNTGSATYVAGTAVTLTANATTGSTFTGWSGEGCSGTGSCTVTMTAARNVTATFLLNTFSLTVNAAGNGAGMVSSNTGGISFSYPAATSGSTNLNYGNAVTLTTTATTGSTVTWFGCDSAGGTATVATCTINSMTSTKIVTATFTLTQYSLTANAAGNGTGTLSSNPSAISYSYPTANSKSTILNYGTAVTLTATAMMGSTIVWSGCDSTGGTATAAICTIAMNATETATATFTAPFNVSIGVFRNGSWYLDSNQNGIWDPGFDTVMAWGIAGDIPIVGDWNGSGTKQIGVFRDGWWYLDYPGTGAWVGCGAPADQTKDVCMPWGIAGDIPVVGDWNGSGKIKIGVFRDGWWYLDYPGTGAWVGCGAPADQTKDVCMPWGIAGDIPVVGDWNGSGKIKIGVFRNGWWYLDYPGTGAWVGCGAPADPSKDACIPWGIVGDIPVVGDWNGSGKIKIGVFRDGWWYLDYPGTGAWMGCGAPNDPAQDACITFGMTGDEPIVIK